MLTNLNYASDCHVYEFPLQIAKVNFYYLILYHALSKSLSKVLQYSCVLIFELGQPSLQVLNTDHSSRLRPLFSYLIGTNLH